MKKQVHNLQEQYNIREKQYTEELKAKAIEERLIQAKKSQQVKLSQQKVLQIVSLYKKKLNSGYIHIIIYVVGSISRTAKRNSK